MAKTGFAKSAYFLVGSGLFLGGVYAVKPWLIGEKISYLLKLHNSRNSLLTKSSSIDKWKKSWYQYRLANKGKDKDIWNLADWNKEDIVKDEALAPISFVDACEENSEARVSGIADELYKQVLKWCTGSSKIKDLIKDSGKRILTDKDSKDSEQYGWKPLWKKYLEANKYKNSNPLSIENWNGSAENPVTDNGMIQKFIDKCKELADKEIIGTTDLLYEKANIHCSSNIRAEDVIRDSYPKKRLIDLTKIKKPESSTPNALAQEIWNKYVKDGRDPWRLITSSSENLTIPSNFWEKCDEKRKTEVKGSEDEVFKEVLNYCTLSERDFQDYGEV